MMHNRYKNWLAIWLICWQVSLSSKALAQDDVDVPLQIRLRHNDGTAVIGEKVVLQQLPEEEAIKPDCISDSIGMCTWHVKRGLYQVLFDRPLDEISAVAVGEGGLLGFGVTVGDEPVAYHFTFHSDGRVYFDTTPDAAAPSPFIPSPEELHQSELPAPIPSLPEIEEATVAPAPTLTNAVEEVVSSDSTSRQFLLFIGLGLIIGAGLTLRSRSRRSSDHKSFRSGDQETNDA
jgi:hypothetical protein